MALEARHELAQAGKALGLICAALLVTAAAAGMVWFVATRQALIAAAAPRHILFRDLYLDAGKLAEAGAIVEVEGRLDIFGDLQAPDGSGASVGLGTEDSPRAVRELFYNCNRRGLFAERCAVRLVGTMMTCRHKANKLLDAANANAPFPCLAVETAILR